MPVLVRALGAGEADLLRRVRLRALADSPMAFASSLAEERDLPAETWAARAAAPGESVFVALDDAGEPLGMAGARPREEDPSIVGLWGMWVDPAARGRGVGGRLVAAVAEWARARGASRLRLGVMSDVPGSVGFYERLGFRPDGEPRTFSRDPTRSWLLMLRDP